MRLAARIDRNHLQIALALRKMGWQVFSLAGVGRGVPDLLISKHGYTALVEVKRDDKAKLTPAQIKFHASWAGKIYVVRSLGDLERIRTLQCNATAVT